MRAALIKTTSMGDVIHTLPVVSDLVTHFPGLRIDWVVEETFADLPRLHPGVDQVVPVAIRRWRRSLLSRATWAEIRATRARLRAARYDLAVDLQGLVKSAWVARWTGAPIAGFDRASVREPLAACAYAHGYPVPRDLHAIERARALAAAAFGYTVCGEPVFGLSIPASGASGALGMSVDWSPHAPYVVFLHATARPEKSWPQGHWTQLGAALGARGLHCVLPWGSARERANAEAIAAAIPGAQVAPRLTLADCARLLAGARAVVGVDTGLTHLAAALGQPTVALFMATQASRYGPVFSPRAASLGAQGVCPRPEEVAQTLVALTDIAIGDPAAAHVRA